MNYYNEFDPKTAAWLRQLIEDGLIPPGDVDERSIKDVQANDIKGYTQCHWFAGIAGWSEALRLAGWPADRPVWTGSCPCQPFSVAGKGEGVNDPRHLWPDFFRLIAECQPAVVFGEQVASKDALKWIDGVFADLEGEDYACAASDLCAAGAGEKAFAEFAQWIRWLCANDDPRTCAHRAALLAIADEMEGTVVGAPHIRQRLFWGAVRLADMPRGGLGIDRSASRRAGHADERGEAGGLADSDGRQSGNGGLQRGGQQRQQPENGGAGRMAVPEGEQRDWPGDARGGRGELADDGDARGVGNASIQGLERHAGHGRDGDEPGRIGAVAPGHAATASAARGFWTAFDLVHCRDGKARRVEPGTFPLAHGVPARVVRLRGYGNAINPHLAAEFIAAFEEACEMIELNPGREAVGSGEMTNA